MQCFHWWCHENYVTLMPVPIVSLVQKVCCTSFLLSLPRECSGVVEDVFGILWCRCQCQWHYMTPSQLYHVMPMQMAAWYANVSGITLTRSHIASHFNSLDLRMLWNHWWCCQHHVTLTPVPITSHDQNVTLDFILIILTVTNSVVPLVIGIMVLMLMPRVLTWQKSHVACHFDHLDITNAMVQLITLLTSMVPHDQKGYVAHCFHCLDLMNGMMLLTVPVALHDADISANSVKWLKNSCCISFQPSITNKCNGAFNDTISVMQCHNTEWWYYKSHITSASIILA